MPTTYYDQFWIIDPYAPPPVGTPLTVNYFAIVDQNNNGLINRFSNDSIDGSDIRSSYPGDTITVDLAGGGTQTITGTTFYLADGRQVFTPTDNSTLPHNATLASTSWVSGQGSMPVSSLGPPCFTPGTRILTLNGPVAVEKLAYGDVVLTVDRGPVPICFIARRVLDEAHLTENPKHTPVKIVAGALGNGLPERDLIVSPQHRVLLRSAIVERMFGENEILVPACQLVGQPGISRMVDASRVEYIHVLLDHHAVIFAEGAETESFFLGEHAPEGFSEREADQIRARMPKAARQNMVPARPFVRGKRLRHLLERHQNNGKPLQGQKPVCYTASAATG